VAVGRHLLEDRVVMSERPDQTRNPGPRWGFAFLRWADRNWPRWFFRLALRAGNAVAVVLLPEQRRQSRAYLTVALGRPARWMDVVRHFELFSEVLLLKMHVGHGRDVACTLAPEHAEAFEALARSAQPALFGTFHVGASDLLGYRLPTGAGRSRSCASASGIPMTPACSASGLCVTSPFSGSTIRPSCCST
jgi:hypothetical protein